MQSLSRHPAQRQFWKQYKNQVSGTFSQTNRHWAPVSEVLPKCGATQWGLVPIALHRRSFTCHTLTYCFYQILPAHRSWHSRTRRVCRASPGAALWHKSLPNGRVVLWRVVGIVQIHCTSDDAPGSISQFRTNSAHAPSRTTDRRRLHVELGH